MEKTYKFEVIGMRKELAFQEDLDINWEPEQNEHEIYSIFARMVDDHLRAMFKIKLYESYGPCGSGYCMASWGHMEITCFDPKHNPVGPLTHNPKKPIFFEAKYDPSDFSFSSVDESEDNWDSWEEVEKFGDVFSVSFNGGDSYYPRGGVWVNEDLFYKLPRAMGERPVWVWIFYGNSGLGKSTIAMNYEYGVFETDSVDELPETIYANIVVFGNRSGFTVEDVIKHLYSEFIQRRSSERARL